MDKNEKIKINKRLKTESSEKLIFDRFTSVQPDFMSYERPLNTRYLKNAFKCATSVNFYPT